MEEEKEITIQEAVQDAKQWEKMFRSFGRIGAVLRKALDVEQEVNNLAADKATLVSLIENKEIELSTIIDEVVAANENARAKKEETITAIKEEIAMAQQGHKQVLLQIKAENDDAKVYYEEEAKSRQSHLVALQSDTDQATDELESTRNKKVQLENAIRQIKVGDIT